MKQKIVLSGVAVLALACAVLAGPPAWKYRTATVPATNATTVFSLPAAGAELAEVRAWGLANNTNRLSVAVSVWAAADGWTQEVASVTYTNASELARYTNVSWRAECTNGWRMLPADTLTVRVGNAVTNGTVTVGFWYYE